MQLEHGIAHIMKKQESDGFKFNMKQADLLLSELRERKQSIEDEVHTTFKPKWVDDKLVTPYIKKDGSLSKRGMTDDEYERCLNTSNYNPFMRKIYKSLILVVVNK